MTGDRRTGDGVGQPGPSQAQIDAAFSHLADGAARLDAMPPLDAARAALGSDATDVQVREWLAVWRPEALRAGDADPE